MLREKNIFLQRWKFRQSNLCVWWYFKGESVVDDDELQVGCPGIKPRWGRDLPRTSNPALVPTEPPVRWIPPRCGVDLNSLLSLLYFKAKWQCLKPDVIPTVKIWIDKWFRTFRRLSCAPWCSSPLTFISSCSKILTSTLKTEASNESKPRVIAC